MPETGSPHEDEGKVLASSEPVSLRSAYHALRRSSTPGVSSVANTLRYVNFMPNIPPRPGSAPPTLRPDMASLTEPNSLTKGGQITVEQVSSGQALPPTMHRPQHPRVTVARPTAYSTNDLQDEACLSEITHILRLQKYHRRCCVSAQDNLQRLQIAASKAARLRLTAQSIQHTLAECIKSEDKSSFAVLLHAFQDACGDVTKISPTTIQDSDSHVAATTNNTGSFLNEVAAPARLTVLDILTKLRYDGQFIAERVMSLTSRELNSLLPERIVAKSNDSIFGASSRNSRNSRPVGFTVDTLVDVLSGHSYGSPLETLVLAPGTSILTDDSERRRTTDVWATVCARLISEQKAGSEKLIPALLDIWFALVPWPGKERIEIWMLETLQRGSFILEQPNKQTFRARVEGRPDMSAQDEARVEAFYARATDSLLGLFGDQTLPSAIPPGALTLCQAIFDKLRGSPSHQRALPSFILTRWLFSSFMTNLVNLPEAYMILSDHYMSDISRQRIVREVAVRAQKAVFDVAYYWKHNNVLMAETVNRVNAVMSRLTGPSASQNDFCTRATPASTPFLVVSLRDATTILSALYPQRRPSSISSDFDASKSGLQSSASSISGFSLFRNTTTPDQWTDDTPGSKPHHNDLFHGTHGKFTKPGSDADIPDDSHVNDAYRDLEDLATRNASSAQELWDVVAIDKQNQSLCVMRDWYSQIRQARRSRSPTSRESVGEAYRGILHHLQVLLHRYGPLDSLERSDSGVTTGSQIWPQLEQLFEIAMQDCQARTDYIGAQQWFQHLQDVHAAILIPHGNAVLHQILRVMQADAQRSIDEVAELESMSLRWSAALQASSSMHNTSLKVALKEHEALRDKMWYISDVRISAAYEEVRMIATALRIMGRSVRTPKQRSPQPLRHWSSTRVSSASLHLKSESQILEILSARLEHGGPNKLSDEQARATMQWMQRENIDNLCKGEERLHKLYLEVRKCVDLVSSSSQAENAMLWSNPLFSSDSSLRGRDAVHRKVTLLPGLYGSTLQSDYLSLSSQLRSNDCLSSTSHTLSNSSSRDYLDARSPTLTNRSSVPFWSPAMSEVDSPSSATSIVSSQTQSALDMVPLKDVANSLSVDSRALERLRQRITSLILSDLTPTLFGDGSETDRAFWTGLGLELSQRHFRSMESWQPSAGSQTPTADTDIPARPSMMRFDYDDAFEHLMQKFTARSNPTTKLACLYDIDRLMVPYMAERNRNMSPQTSFVRTTQDLTHLTLTTTGSEDATGVSIAGFRSLFAKSTLRPLTIFRDLQSIASLLPASVLQNTPQGKAFTNAAVAITTLKTEARKIMVETADSIIAYHSNNRGHGRTSSTAQQERDSAIFSAPSPPAEDVSRYTMADAAHLLQITAKEGDHVAQRELATLYLTHPELMELIIAPFARPKDVFRDELEGKWKKSQDPHRMDPTTMCVAHHWMSLSSKGGDSLAKEYLRQREEMDSF